MATQELKDKKIATAERELSAATTRLEKASERLATFKAGYEAKVKELEDAVTAARSTATAAGSKLEWTRGMPVDGAVSAPVAQDGAES